MNAGADTSGQGGPFPVTRHSLIRSARGDDPDTRRIAMNVLIEAYWKPVYKYLRVRWRADAENAQDLTQGFFVTFLERGHLDRYDPERGRFRTYLRVCLDGYAANERKAARAQKRGGGAIPLSLDFEGADGELHAQQIPDTVDVEEFFRREWIRHLFSTSVEALGDRCRATGREKDFLLFERADLAAPADGRRPTYADLAVELELTVSQVTNHLHGIRALFRKVVLERLAEITGTEEEFREEAREILGVWDE